MKVSEFGDTLVILNGNTEENGEKKVHNIIVYRLNYEEIVKNYRNFKGAIKSHKKHLPEQLE